MTERAAELQAILDAVGRRWRGRSWLQAAAIGGFAAAVFVIAGWLAVTLVAGDGLPLIVVAAVVLLGSTFALGRAYWISRTAPSNRQVARLIEERDGELDDVVATAVDFAERPDASPQMREAVLGDAARALSSRGLPGQLDRIISRDSVRRAAWQASAAAGVLVVAFAAFAPSLTRATRVTSAYLFPTRLVVEVTPGSTKVRAGQPLTITARVAGLAGELVPTLTVAVKDDQRSVRMTPTNEAGTFALTIEAVTASFNYHVTAANTRSNDFAVTMVRPPRVERIDLHYDFPPGLGLEARTDEDSGDIYGPAGTRVRLAIVADKAIASAFLLLDDGGRLPLTVNGTDLDGGLTIEDDGSYRIALADHDGLESGGETEYFIRTLNDRPPDVRIIRPASDKPVTPLEEVHVEARADDDFGIASLELVFQTPSGKERVVPLRTAPSPSGSGGESGRGNLTATGRYTLFMEDLRVQPGDFVTYHARARDVNRGRRAVEVRSDIFFLEVKPFEEEFVMAQSQQMGQGMQSTGLEQLAEAQKQILIATWNLDARARRARGTPSPQDIKAVSKSQSELRDRAQLAATQSSRVNDPRARRRGNAPVPGEDPLGKAVEAMGRAVAELDKSSTSGAVPHEMEALNQLLKAEAENRRRQVTRSQQAGGGGGQNRSEADLSTLFDQELRKRQQTNYESPNSTEERQDTADTDPLDRIRELARRQDMLNRQQRDLARNREQLNEEELKRQLERLTREQNELRQQAEELARQIQNGQQQGQRGSQPQDESRRLREASEDMRNAATGLRRQDTQQAAQNGNRAAERLRDLERQMQTSRPDERRRALGDLQLEARQLADAERHVGSEANRTSAGQSGDDARRRLAAEQERLAERAERLQDKVERLSQSGQAQSDERRATEDASRELDRQQVPERMRQSANALRGGAPQQGSPEDVAKALDRVAEQLGAASGTQDADSRRFSDQLGKTQELRDKMRDLDRNLEELQRASQNQPGQQPGQQGQQGQPPSAGSSGSATGANAARLEQLQREVNDQMRDVQRMAESIQRGHPDMPQRNPDAEWWRSFSAPGTEAFKQDFSRWESLKSNLLVALENVETKLSGELRARENSQRLTAGGHEAVSEAYRPLVEKYYRSLASPRKPR